MHERSIHFILRRTMRSPACYAVQLHIDEEIVGASELLLCFRCVYCWILHMLAASHHVGPNGPK